MACSYRQDWPGADGRYHPAHRPVSFCAARRTTLGQAVILYRRLWMAAGYHLVRVRVETAGAGIWASSTGAVA